MFPDYCRRLIFSTAGLILIVLPGFAERPGEGLPTEIVEKLGLKKMEPDDRAALEKMLFAWADERAEFLQSARREAEWGFEETLPSRRAEAIERDETPRQIVSRIDGSLNGWSGNTLFVLDNGQVWRQTDQTRVSARLDNVEVTISRGAFGSYRLQPSTLNSSVRVRRVR